MYITKYIILKDYILYDYNNTIQHSGKSKNYEDGS